MSRGWRLGLFFLLIGLTTLQAQSKKQQELEAKRQAILEEIKQINTLLFKTQGEKKSILTQVQDLDQRINARENLIRVTNQQANLLTREINDNLQEMERLREELVLLKEDYAGMISKSYKSKSQQSRLMFLFSSTNFLQAYKRMQYMKQYTKHRKAQGERIRIKSEQLQMLNTRLIEQKNEKELLIAENRQERSKLLDERKQQQGLVASLRQEESRFTRQIRDKQAEASRLERQIDAIIREAIAEANKSSGNTTTTTLERFALTPEAKALAANFTTNKGKLPWPVRNGVVTERFGTRRHPQFPQIQQTFSGVEIATEANSKARAVFNGVVFRIQQLKGANKAVYIRHGDYITIYNNLASISVKSGDRVTTNQEIGTVFTHPTTNEATLKFFIYKNTKKLNPADWIYRM
ncbi:murein hydrolase activator EnvC family protein [Aureitalea marina]|uniref:Peptidase M23 n=1 Tax=Aureitalea marina TaxID=930804 RepID=A0A2S7KSD6_9FLAO|nr:peptidoglycan DD-metalloendopeptidase family protein [Aureitalea marina]PQB05517.1 peptidase M23 [Aureitalea marina]